MAAITDRAPNTFGSIINISSNHAGTIVVQGDSQSKEKALTSSAEKVDEQTQVVLKQAEAHLVLKEQFSLVNPEITNSMKKYVLVGAVAGAKAGAWVGFAVGGGVSAGAGCIPGTLIGAGVGGLGCAGIAAIGFMIKNSREYDKWRCKQSEETLIELRKVFKVPEHDNLLCPITFEVMQNPTTTSGKCRCTVEHEVFVNALNKSRDTREFLDADKRQKNPDFGKTYCPVAHCEVRVDELRPDYGKMAHLTIVYKDLIQGKLELATGKISGRALEGVKVLYKDLRAKSNWYYKLEKDAYGKLLKEGTIRKKHYYCAMNAITSCLDPD